MDKIDLSNVKVFQDLLISIAFILLDIFVRYQEKKFIEIKIIFMNQIKIFNKISEKLNNCYLKNPSTMLITSLQSISIIKYFIIRSYHVRPEAVQLGAADDGVVTYNYQVPVSFNFHQLNSFEITNLHNCYKNWDYNQDGIHKSDSYKIRRSLWYLMSFSDPDFQSRSNQLDESRFDNITINLESLPGVRPSTKYKVVLPNQRKIGITLIREFCLKIININNGIVVKDSNFKIEEIFRLIEQSNMEYILKFNWKKCFSWILHHIPNTDYDTNGVRIK